MERILEAAQALMAERGAGALTIADVADRAGVSVGTIYSRFSGKEALIAATQERWLDEVTAFHQVRYAETAAQTQDFEEFVIDHVAAMVAEFRSEADLIREFAVRTIGQASSSDAAKRGLQETFTLGCEALLSHPGRPPHVGQVQVSLALRAAQATLEWRVTMPLADAPDNDWDLLAVELPRLVLSCLVAEAPDRAIRRP